MKLFLIVVMCSALMACGSSSEGHSTPNEVVADFNPLPSNGGGGPMPCDRVYVITITTDAGTFRKEVPVYCNPNPGPDHGDPPDFKWSVDPNPWDKQIIEVHELNEQQQSAR
jgi:hypothetical protein